MPIYLLYSGSHQTEQSRHLKVEELASLEKTKKPSTLMNLEIKLRVNFYFLTVLSPAFNMI